MSLPQPLVNSNKREITVNIERNIRITSASEFYNFTAFSGYTIIIHGNRNIVSVDLADYNEHVTSTWYEGLIKSAGETTNIIVENLVIETRQYCKACFIQDYSIAYMVRMNRCRLLYDVGGVVCGGMCGRECSVALVFDSCNVRGNTLSGAFVGPGYAPEDKTIASPALVFDDCTCELQKIPVGDGGYIGKSSFGHNGGVVKIGNSTVKCNEIGPNGGGFVGQRFNGMTLVLMNCCAELGSVGPGAGGYVGAVSARANINIVGAKLECTTITKGAGGLIGSYSYEYGGKLSIANADVTCAGVAISELTGENVQKY